MKISILIPVYGVEKYIEKCARSVFEQSYEDLEIIFVDDCTEDRSIQIVIDLLESYPKTAGKDHQASCQPWIGNGKGYSGQSFNWRLYISFG